jgi:hypothetical protein
MEYMTNLNIEIDRDLKARADRLFNEMEMGITNGNANCGTTKTLMKFTPPRRSARKMPEPY